MRQRGHGRVVTGAGGGGKRRLSCRMSRKMGGMRMSPTKDATILPKAAPMTTPTASSTTLPRMTNSLNSRSMEPSSRSAGAGSVGLSPEERRDIQVLFARHVGVRAGIGGHPPAPVLGRGGAAASGGARHVHHLARG